MHFVNAVYDTTTHDAYAITDMLKRSLEIVKEEFGDRVNEQSMHYERFMAHLKFLARRISNRELLKDEEIQMAEEIKRKYVREYACCQKIVNFIRERYATEITGEEQMYLTIHIRRILMKDDE